MLPLVRVAVGILFNTKGEILLAQRPVSTTYAGFWEFPGGKLENDETSEQALRRELQEELGIVVQTAVWLLQRYHAYPEYTVELNVWCVRDFLGEPCGLQGQLLQWVRLDEVRQFQLLDANSEIITALHCNKSTL